MAEENTGKEVNTEKKTDFIKMVLIGLVVFLIAIGSSFFLLRSMIQPLFPEYRTSKAEEAHTVGNLVNIGEFLTNLNDNKFIRMVVTVEIASDNEKAMEMINSSIPIVKDTILNIISAKTNADFDPRNRENLRSEIKNALNTRLGNDPIFAVYFEQLVIQ